MKFQVKIRKGRGPVFDDAYSIRTKVFVEEQGFVDVPDEIDDTCWHAVVYNEKIPIGCGRMFSVGEDVFHIGRVAVLSEYRGKQIGRCVMQVFEEHARKISVAELELCSQLHAQGFYERCGYRVRGEVFYEQGQPHVEMVKEL